MSCNVEIEVELLKGAVFPKYGSLEAAGADVRANIEKSTTIKPGERALISTGLIFHTPKGYEIQVRPRSGLAFKHGITVLNTPGTIDSDYRGEVKILLLNTSDENFIVEPQMRIAQLIIAPVVTATFKSLTSASVVETQRGSGGFGSTGTK